MYVLETKRKERTQLYKTTAWLNVGCEISHELKQSNFFLKKNCDALNWRKVRVTRNTGQMTEHDTCNSESPEVTG